MLSPLMAVQLLRGAGKGMAIIDAFACQGRRCAPNSVNHSRTPARGESGNQMDPYVPRCAWRPLKTRVLIKEAEAYTMYKTHILA